MADHLAERRIFTANDIDIFDAELIEPDNLLIS